MVLIAGAAVGYVVAAYIQGEWKLNLLNVLSSASSVLIVSWVQA